MNDCKGLLGRWFGHQYEPIYDYFPPHVKGLGGSDPVGVVKALTTRQYRGLFCARCGDRKELKP